MYSFKDAAQFDTGEPGAYSRDYLPGADIHKLARMTLHAVDPGMYGVVSSCECKSFVPNSADDNVNRPGYV